MDKKLLIILLVVGMIFLLLGSVSAYYCIYPEDNNAVRSFKIKVNDLAIQHDVDLGITLEAIKLKARIFSPCKKWQLD